jgi:SAM-dependent methyltransferase
MMAPVRHLISIHSMSPVPSVTQFYDTHPINEEQILHALQTRGIPLESLTEDILRDHDQDHFGGLQANEILFTKAGIRAEHLVLDVCSGMGGPARDLARRVGCRVVGLDLTESRHLSSVRLTQWVKLDHLVSFRLGNALDMPFDTASFDVAIGQEAWCHVPDKAKLISECARVVKPGGIIAFTDILRQDSLSPEEWQRLSNGMAFPTLESLKGYVQLLRACGFDLLDCEDLSAHWAGILVDRLALYRSLNPDTERKFGAARSREWDAVYEFFVGLYTQGKLGGGRFIAERRMPG